MRTIALTVAAGGCMALGCATDSPANDDGLTLSTSGISATLDPTGVPLDESTGADSTDDGATSIVPDDSSTTASDESSTGDPPPPPPPPVCGNNIKEGDEVCDLTDLAGQTCESLGHDGGTLTCFVNCTGFNVENCYVCGNGMVDPAEDCEGELPPNVTCESLGLGGGTVVCGDDCFYDTSDCSVCGDGVRQGIEVCDGNDLGGATCASLGLSGGDLGCTQSCTFDFLGCDIAGMPFGNDGSYQGFVLQPAILPCDDISGTGTVAGLSDDSNTVVNIGFTMQIYGTGQTQANIQSNGAVGFGNFENMSLSNSCLPTNTLPTSNMLYVFWDDLNPAAAGAVRYQTLGSPGNQRFVVQWDVPHYGGNTNDLIRVQAVMHEASGQIEVCYPDTLSAGNFGDNGAEATSGLQGNTMTAVQFSCDTPTLTSGTMLLYIPI